MKTRSASRIAVLLAVLMVLQCMPFQAFADKNLIESNEIQLYSNAEREESPKDESKQSQPSGAPVAGSSRVLEPFSDPETEETQVTVTFVYYDADNERIHSVVPVSEEGSVTAPSVPVRAGCTFVRWDTPFTDVTQSITVTAIYRVTVRFMQYKDLATTPVVYLTKYLQEGKIYNNIGDANVGSMTQPAAIHRVGYAFTGRWMLEDGITVFDQNERFGKSIDVYAEYKPLPLLTFSHYTGTGTAPTLTTQLRYLYDGKLYYTTKVGEQQLTAQTMNHRYGYEFMGWEPADYLNLTETQVVNAVYEARPTVRFNYYSGTSAVETTMTAVKECWTQYGDGYYSTSAKMTALPSAGTATHRVGYEYTGKWLMEDGSYFDLDTVITESVTVHAEYKPLPLLTFSHYTGTGTAPTLTTQLRYLYDGKLYYTTKVGEQPLTAQTMNHRYGYEFMGWEPADYLNLTEMQVVNAVYEARPTVKFNYYSGTSAVETTMTAVKECWTQYGDGYYSTSAKMIALPSAGTATHRVGYEYTGKWLMEDGSYFDLDTVITESVTVHAEYKPLPLLTFSYYSGTNTAQTTMPRYLYNSALYNTTSTATQALTALTKQHRYGYEFMGWEPADYLNLTEMQVVNAVYEARPTVRFNYYSGTSAVETTMTAVKECWTQYGDGYYSTSAKMTALPSAGTATHRVGHEYTGKWLMEDGSYFDLDTVITESVTVHAEYKPLPLLTFSYYSGTNTAPTTMPRYLYNSALYSTTSTSTQALSTLTKQHRTGFDFLGWEPADYLNLTESQTVNAVYSAQPTVTFAYYSGTLLATSIKATWIRFDDGFYIGTAKQSVLPSAGAVTHRMGYEYTGKWLMEDGSYFDLDTDITQSVTVYAEYRPLPLLTFSYYSGVSTTPSLQSRYLYDRQLYSTTASSVSALPALDKFHRIGYEFIGWEPANYAELTSSTLVRAVYSQALPSVTFMRYSGAGTTPTALESWVLYSDGFYVGTAKRTALPDPGKLHRTGYEFIGWDWDITEDLQSSITVTALYKPLPALTFSYLSGTSLNPTTAVRYVYGGALYNGITLATEPILDKAHRSGYEFVGWDKANFTAMDKSATINAVYTQAQTTVTFMVYSGTSTTPTVQATWTLCADGFYSGAAKQTQLPALARNHRTGYEFLGWDWEMDENISGSIVVNARYSGPLPSATFMYYNGAATTASVNATWYLFSDGFYNGTVKQSALPTLTRFHRTGYEYLGWDWEMDESISGPIVVNARYSGPLPSATFMYYNGAAATASVNATWYLYSDGFYNGTTKQSALPSLTRFHRTGYDYFGWDWQMDAEIEESVTVNARYSEPLPKVSFMYYNGAAADPSVNATWYLYSDGFYNGSTKQSALPTLGKFHRTGYTASGRWLTEGSQAFDMTMRPTESMDLSAEYVAELPSVTFMYYSAAATAETVYTSWTLSDGQFWNASAAMQTMLPDPGKMHRTGYEFLGWDWEIKDGANGPVVAHAQYRALPVLTFSYYNAASTTPTLLTRYLYNGRLYNGTTLDAEPSLNVLHRTGYAFTGWEPADYLSLTESGTVDALYSELPTVKFNYISGTSATSLIWSLFEGNFYNGTTKQTTLPVLTMMHRTNYEFLGWDWVMTNELTESIEVNAVYSAEPVPTVKFMYYNGAATAESTAATWLTFSDGYYVSSTRQTSLPVLSKAHRTGYVFTGRWLKGDMSEFDMQEPVTEPLVLYAEYSEPLPTVTFMYYNGAATTQTVYATWTQSEGRFVNTSALQTALPNPGATHRSGYAFTGRWLLGDGTPWTMDANLTEPIVLLAEYSPLPTVTFHYYEGQSVTPTQIVWTLYQGEFYIGATKQTVLPSPAANHRTGYQFVGWGYNGLPWIIDTGLNESIVVEARYDVYVKFQYFMGEDEAVTTETVLVSSGEAVTPPTLDPRHRSGYTFTGWDVEASAFEHVTKSSTVFAVYKADEFSVRFLDYDESPLLLTQSVEYKTAARVPTPVREGYTFTGWEITPKDANPGYVVCDMTLKAQYEINEYTVEFVDASRTKTYGAFQRLYLESIDEGSEQMLAILAQAEADAPEDYTFSHWSRTLSKVTGNMIVFPYYKANLHTVLFLDYNGDELGRDFVAHGEAAREPVYVDPNHREGFTVTGWDRSLENITADTTITATYSRDWIKVTHQDEDGHKYKLQLVPFGEDAEPPANPTRAGYSFAGWSDEGKNVTQERVINAIFVKLSYEVTFLGHGDVSLGSRTVQYGETPDTEGIITAYDGHVFTGWAPPIARVKETMTTRAQYRPYDITVRFLVPVDGERTGGSLLMTRKAVLDEASGQYGVELDGAYTWTLEDAAFDGTIPGAYAFDGSVLDVYAQQSYHTVTLVDSVSGASRTQLVMAGERIAPEPLAHDGFLFLGWVSEGGPVNGGIEVSGPLTLTATYEQVSGDIRWISYHDRPEDQGGSVVYRQSAVLGGSVSEWPDAAYAPTLEGYTFSRWDAALPLENVTSDLDVYPIFEALPKAVFYNWDSDMEPLYQQSAEWGTRVKYQGALPTRAGYDFAGWYPDPAHTPIVKDTEFVAQFHSPQERTYLLSVFYRFENGNEAARPYTASLPYGESYDVPSPAGIQGFEPDQAKIQGYIDEDTPTQIVHVVTYLSSTGTDYVVCHYQQKLGMPIEGGDDQDLGKYNLVLEEKLKAMTGSTVRVTPKDYAGFNVLPNQNLTQQISADGKAVINVFYTRNVFGIYFLSLGGSYVEPIVAEVGADIGAELRASKVSARAGYTFAGWDQQIPDKMPAGGAQISAIWVPDGTVPYTLVYWRENVNGDGYDFYETATRAGMVATPIALGEADLPEFEHFNYDRYDQGKTITGNGSTIVNVYYTRNDHTITFNKAVTGEYLGHITAKYGANVVRQWAETTEAISTETEDYTSVLWSWVLSGVGPWSPMIEIMPGNDVTFYGQLTTGSLYQNFHLVQPLDVDNRPISNFDNYSLYTTVKVKYSSNLSSTFTEDFFPIDGYTRVWSSLGNWSEETKPGTSVSYGADKEIRFYYNLKQYQVTFLNGDRRPETVTAYYTQPLSSIYREPTSRPTGVGADWVFDGWYQTQDGSDVKFDFGSRTMPSLNLAFYAKWQPPVYNVDFRYVDADGEEQLFDAQLVNSGSYAHNPDAQPSVPGYLFQGWYERGAGVAFQFDTQQIVRGTVLEAKWVAREDIAYTVNYYLVPDDWSQEGDPTTELLGSVAPNPKQVGNQRMGSTIYEEAPTVNGFTPDLVSKSLALKAQDNALNFYYKSYSLLAYTVFYLDTQGKELLSPKEVKDERRAVVIETAPSIEGYSAQSAQETLRLGMDSTANKIVFVYAPNVEATYRVEHYYMDLVTGNYGAQPDDVEGVGGELKGPAGLKVFAMERNLGGYSLDQANSVTTGFIEPGNGLVLRMYYRRANVPWTVNFFRYGTRQSVAPSLRGELRLGFTKEAAEQILGGYTYVGSDPASKRLTLTGDPSKNEINFYYKKDITVRASQVVRDYTGQNQVAPGLTQDVVITPELYGDHALGGATVSFGAPATDVGLYPNNAVPSGLVLGGGEPDQYNISYEPADLVIRGRVTYHSNYPAWCPLPGATYLDPTAYQAGEPFSLADIQATGFGAEYLEFAGWSTKDGGAIDSQMGAASVDVYAQWRATLYTLTVHHYLENSTIEVAEDQSDVYRFDQEYRYDYHEDIPGYAPMGTGASGNMPARDLEITLYYRAIPYTLTLHHYEIGTTTSLMDDETGEYFVGAPYEYPAKTIAAYAPITDKVSGAMPAGDLELVIYYRPVSEKTLTLHHYEQNTTTRLADDEYFALEPGESYNYPPKADIRGFTPIGTGVSGIMQESDVDETIFYTRNLYTLTVHHYLQGTATSVAPDQTDNHLPDAPYSYGPVSVDGHTAVGTGVSGNMPMRDHEVTIFYTPNNYALTVHHYLQGTTTGVAPDQTASHAYGSAYTYAPLSIAGYTAVGGGGSGTMPMRDLEVAIYYTIDNYVLTVHHYLQGTTTRVSPDQTASHSYGAAYTYAPQSIAGYTAVDGGGSGTMPARNYEVTVFYTRSAYTLTVHHYLQGTNASIAPDQTGRYFSGEAFSYAPVAIAGYDAVGTGVTGTMPARNHEVTIFYAHSAYTLTVKHYLQGTKVSVAAAQAASLQPGQQYSYPPLTISGYTGIGTGASGVMPARDCEEAIYYVQGALPAGVRTLTVHHYLKGTSVRVAADQIGFYLAGDPYAYSPLSIGGYEPIGSGVAGSMPDKNHEEIIYYAPNGTPVDPFIPAPNLPRPENTGRLTGDSQFTIMDGDIPLGGVTSQNVGIGAE